MALDWLPILDEPHRPRLLGAEYQPHYAGNSREIPAISAWLAIYPHRVWRTMLPVACRPALFYPANDYPALPTPELSWKANYPDFLIGRRLVALSAYTWVPFSRATELTQFPSYPDRLDRRVVHVSGVPFLSVKLEGIPPVLSWKGDQPDRIWPAVRLQPSTQLHYQFHAEPVPDPPPPGLGYETTSYPLFIHPKSTVPLPSKQVFGANLDPIPNPPPPTDFNSPPIFPSWIFSPSARRGSDARTSEAVIPIGGAAGNDLRWLPSYPLFHVRRRAQATLSSFQVGETLSIPIARAWRPSFPDLLRRPVSVNDFIGFDPLSVASLLPVPPECIAWTVEGFEPARLTEEAITRSGFSDEDPTRATLSTEETC